MNEHQTVRGRSVSAGFGLMIARCVERRIATANAAMADGLGKERHIGALRLLAGRLAGLDVFDPRLEALWQARNALGRPQNEGTFEVEPGSEQNAVLCRAGVDIESPDTDRLLAELVAAALEDVVNIARARLDAERRERQAAVTEAKRLAPFEQRAHAAETANVDLEADLRIAREERARAEREATYLRSQLDPEKGKSGQTNVEGEPYIYRRDNGKFKSQPPGRPAKTFDTLDEAKAYRDEAAVAA